MKRSSTILSVLLLMSMLGSCGAPESQSETEDVAVEQVPEQIKLFLSEVTSPEFPDSGLELITPGESESLASGSLDFEYNVKNYELGTQTLDADVKLCANSAKGQHIHLILNNEPYTAHYEPNFEKELADGHYVALSFISRSYHESLKHYGAYNLRQFTVGETISEPVDLTTPHMFYSRPKGTYKGADTERVLLDFYLVNTELARDGNKVKATINDQEFTIDKWAPYFIEGLPMGENTIKLELLDDAGNSIPGPYNTVERTITLSPADA